VVDETGRFPLPFERVLHLRVVVPRCLSPRCLVKAREKACSDV
jgi:hypothetical protein